MLFVVVAGDVRIFSFVEKKHFQNDLFVHFLRFLNAEVPRLFRCFTSSEEEVNETTCLEVNEVMTGFV